MLVLTTEQRAVLTTRLAEAQAAYHSLMLGGQVKVVVDQNGERVEYQQSSIPKLVGYIATLQSQLGIGCPAGPMNVWF